MSNIYKPSTDSPSLSDEILIIQSGQTKSIKLNNIKSIDIPIPDIKSSKNQIGDKDIIVQWKGSNKEFLQFSPKYFLFRYRGKGKHTGNKKGRKGFTHPTHLRGESCINKSYWGGSEYFQNETIIPSRITEWEVPQYESKELFLNLNINDWVYCQDVMPCRLYNFRVKSGSRGNHNVYFYICIGIHLENLSGCPYIFGPPSQVFGLRPNIVDNQYGIVDKLYNGWSYFINK